MEIWSSVEIFPRSVETCWKEMLLLLKFFWNLSIAIIDFLLSKKFTFKYSLKIIWKNTLQIFHWNIFKMSYSEQNETKKLSSLESQIYISYIYVGMCTQN